MPWYPRHLRGRQAWWHSSNYSDGMCNGCANNLDHFIGIFNFRRIVAQNSTRWQNRGWNSSKCRSNSRRGWTNSAIWNSGACNPKREKKKWSSVWRILKSLISSLNFRAFSKLIRYTALFQRKLPKWLQLNLVEILPHS